MGKFLTVDYCLRTIGYCSTYYFLETFVGVKALMEGDKSRDGVPPPPGKTLGIPHCTEHPLV